MCLWGWNPWARLPAREAAPSMHPAWARELRAGCSADRRCIQRRARAARLRPCARANVELISRSAAFLLVGFPIRRLLIRLYQVQLLAVLERICRVDDDLIGARDAAESFERRAVVASNVDGPQLHLAAGPDDRHLRALGPEQHRVHWNRDLIHARTDCEVYFPEGAGQQAAVLVRYIDFRQQCPRGWINSLRRTYDLTE